jgi:kynureninase
VIPATAKVVGAKDSEVTVMNSLTVNIHLGLVPFYKPTPQRYKILMEERPFPSDLYAVQSQVRWHGYDPKSSIVYAKIRETETVWRDEDIVDLIEEMGDTIALVFLSGVHFATGYFFDIKAITEAGHRKGCYVGWDLAHAAGNVELALHDWGVDFACWCTYKYLNAGPGSIGGFFVHEKHGMKPELTRLLGWWAHNRDSRFQMDNVLDLQPGAKGFQLSNPPVLECCCLLASLQVFEQTSMSQLVCKSRLLTGYLELLMEGGLVTGDVAVEGKSPQIEIVTSRNPERRGNQLSVRFPNCNVSSISDYLKARAVVVDFREPDIMRVSPSPLYNSFCDVLRFYRFLKEAIMTCYNK